MKYSFSLILAFLLVSTGLQAQPKTIDVQKINPTTVEVLLEGNGRMTFDFYGENIFRLFQDNAGGILRAPEARPEAQILVDNPRKAVSKLDVDDQNGIISISTEKITIQLDKKTSLLKVTNKKTGAVAFEEVKPILFQKGQVTLTLKENPNEYFYGGGVQNGRFSHKGKTIAIENQNSWTDGGVASPNPFYWSTNGYAMMWHTFKMGRYAFGSEEKGLVQLLHTTDYLDVFFMINDGAVALLNDFYQLTGNPVLLPKFGFYQGHLNAYNRDYWKEDETGILFEDGKRYKESQKDNGGTKESLNGEFNNYQFSARAVIDRYKKADMPLGWILPNDGYGAGYGQTETLDGNIQNLKSLGDYAHKNGVEIGLWTQSDLHPKPEISALLQRDLVKEVRDAGVRVLKTDVAWVGRGYSFGLNGVADAAGIMTYYGNHARPFIISLDGWAGTQRYAGVWSGDQTGGLWEYIRFHIPTYIGSGLSGMSNITSDMDGIFGGKNAVINTRDFQWKTWTPMQLNMDGWGSNEKYPQALGEPATSINRYYLKLKSALMPYTYSIAKEAIDGLPIMRAMFLEYPNNYTLGKATQYQFLYGSNFLVAPIYQATKSDTLGNDIRNGIYLPEGQWIDYFSGEKYNGNVIVNNFAAPIWKLPVFVKNGAIIPMTNPNNNVSEIKKDTRIYEIFPYGHSEFAEYDDDGVSEAYRLGQGATTRIESEVDAKNLATITIHPTQGDFNGFVKEKTTEFRINVTAKPKKVLAAIGGKVVKLTEATSNEAFVNGENVYFYNADYQRFVNRRAHLREVVQSNNSQLLIKLAKTDITTAKTTLSIDGFVYEPIGALQKTGALTVPKNAKITDENAKAYTLTPTWSAVDNADFYEIDLNGMRYTTIRDTELQFEGLDVETKYDFNLRAVNKDGFSDWTTFSGKTKSDPLEFAVKGITGISDVKNQSGSALRYLFDGDESTMWHTRWDTTYTSFEIVLDLHAINQLDKIHYLPRQGASNGTILKGSIATGNDQRTWTDAGSFEWTRNDEVKVFTFADRPSAKYVKLTVNQGVGGFGSGLEMYVFRVAGTESYLPGDINNDKLVDENDFTSYINYTGLKAGDSDFEGYISKGDLNQNGRIDVYDISVVATLLEGRANRRVGEKIAGSIELVTPKKSYNADEIIEITVKGKNLKSVNALGFSLPYNQQDYEFIGIEPLNMQRMVNLTNDRLHTDGSKVLYPTFVNKGAKPYLEGSSDLFILKFKAKRKLTFDLKLTDGLLVDSALNTI
ncbi:alpha-xylosidase [Bacteroidia bacterium]|nr:alpha-xylosidase [Bacteroidia bacterium]